MKLQIKRLQNDVNKIRFTITALEKLISFTVCVSFLSGIDTPFGRRLVQPTYISVCVEGTINVYACV